MHPVTKREKIMVGAAVSAVVLMCFYVFVYQPKNKQCMALQERIKRADLEIERIVRAIPDLEKLEKEVARERKRVSLVKKTTSDMKPIEQILQQLARDTCNLGIDVISMQLVEESKPSLETSRYRKMNIVINIQCPYRCLGSYLKGLGDLPGLFIIDGLEIVRDNRIFPKLRAKLTLSTYISGKKV